MDNDTTTTSGGFWDDAELIHSYSRAEAIDDGVLVDVTETAREAGFVMPVALTRAVWCQYVEVPKGVRMQDERGRLWDVLSMLRFAIKVMKGRDPVLLYKLHVKNSNRAGMGPLVVLKSICGPADDGEPCITIMLPEES